MENINLAVGYGGKKDRNVLNSGMRWVVWSTVAVAAIYVGLLAFGRYLDSRNADLGLQYQNERQSFMNQDAAKVLDFQNRITISKDLSQRQRDAVMDMRALEGLIVSGVYVDSYQYDESGESVKVKCVAGDYATMAKQILSFNGSTYFSVVDAGQSAMDSETRKVSFEATLRIN